MNNKQSDQALHLHALILISLKMIMDRSKKWKVDYSIEEIQQVGLIAYTVKPVN